MSARKFNMIACSRNVLRFLRAKPGHKLLYLDFNSVEPTLLAHFSQDPTYMKLYGKGSNPNHCAYIYVGSHLSAFQDKFLPHYDLDAPSKEGVSFIKTEYAGDRDVCKNGHLSMQYGAFPKRIHAELGVRDVKSMLPEFEHLPYSERPNITLEECEEFHRQYWQLFRQVKAYTRELEEEWKRNSGYIVNGRGRPLPLFKMDTKDLLSRMIQSTAHDYLMRYLWHINLLRKSQGVRMRPWLVDLHDATTWEVPDEAVEEATQLMTEALQNLNNELQLSVQIRGQIKVSQTFEVAS